METFGLASRSCRYRMPDRTDPTIATNIINELIRHRNRFTVTTSALAFGTKIQIKHFGGTAQPPRLPRQPLRRIDPRRPRDSFTGVLRPILCTPMVEPNFA